MIEDIYGHQWEKERFNGYAIGGIAISLINFLATGKVDHEQQTKEQPIGGWRAAYNRTVQEMNTSCPPGFRVGYAPFEFQNRHVLTYLKI